MKIWKEVFEAHQKEIANVVIGICILVITSCMLYQAYGIYQHEKHLKHAQKMIKLMDAGDSLAGMPYDFLQFDMKKGRITQDELCITQERVDGWFLLAAQADVKERLAWIRDMQSGKLKYDRSCDSVFDKMLDPKRIARAELTLGQLGTSVEELQRIRHELFMKSVLQNLSVARASWIKKDKDETAIAQVLKDARAGLVKLDPAEYQKYVDYAFDRYISLGWVGPVY